MIKHIILVVGLILLFSWSVHAQTALGANDVFIKNNNPGPANYPVNIPIAFASGTYSSSQLVNGVLPNVRVGNWPTQVVPTSYYKNGSIRTAIARVLVSLNAGQEVIEAVTTGSSPAFQMNTRVDDLIHNRNGAKLRVAVTDIKGGTYDVVLDVDGYGNDCQFAGTDFPANCVKLLEDGPVAKVWEIHKRHEPVAGGNPEDLSYLFSSVFYVTVLSGKDYALVDHLLVNSNNLDEDPDPAPNGGPNNGLLYSNPQHGVIFYTDARMETTTPSGANHQVYLLDEPYVQPSNVDPASTPTNSTYWIMPADGQQILSASTYGEGPSLSAIPNPSNYIAGGQSILSRLVIGFSSISSHPFYENNIDAGGSLAMYSRVSDTFFRELVNPDFLRPATDFDSDAASELTFYKGRASNPAWGHRFGQYDITQGKNMAATGYPDLYAQEHSSAVRFFLSCVGRCETDYARSLRYHLYATSAMTNHIVGYRHKDHPQGNLNDYGTPLIENHGTGSTITCDNTNGSKDLLGFCQSVPSGHRVDAVGNTIATYDSATSSSRAMFHGWTMREPAHLSVGMEYYWYIFSGDYAARYYVINIAETASSPFYYSYLNPSAQGGVSDRGRGRALIWVSHLFSLTLDPYYKTYANGIIELIDRVRDKRTDGFRGTNPATGDYYPVGYYNQSLDSDCWGQPEVKPFQHSQISHGLAVAYRDILTAGTDQPLMDKIKTITAAGLHFIFTYAYKSPLEVRNGVSSLNGSGTINEGGGGFANYYCVLVSQGAPNSKYTNYKEEQQQEFYPGICNELITAYQIRQADPTYLMNGSQDLLAEYLVKFKDAYKRAWVHSPIKNRFYDKSNYGLSIAKIEDEYLCGLALALETPTGNGGGYVNGVYQSSSPMACTDSDGDSFTTCAGDCQDSGSGASARNPGVNENPGGTSGATKCSNGIDDNCNGLVDCADPVCTSSSACANAASRTFCGNHTLNTLESCDVITPSIQITPPTGIPGPVNNCGGIGAGLPLDPLQVGNARGYCVPAFVSMTNGCQCASSSFYFGSLSTNPSPVIVNTGPTTLTLNGTGFQSGDQVEITKQGTTTTILLTPTNITSSQITATLTQTQNNSLGVGSHQTRVKQGSAFSNTQTLSIQNVPVLGLTNINPNTVIYNQNSSTLTLTGTAFVSGDQAEFTGPTGTVAVNTTFVSSTSLTTSLTAAQTVSIGQGSNGTVRIKRGASTFSNTVPFNITGALPTVTVSVPDASAAETLASQTADPGMFRITRSIVTSSPLAVTVAVSGGSTATAGVDYQTISLPLQTIPANAAFVDVPVTVIDDSSIESSETVTFSVSAPGAGAGAYTAGSPAFGTVTIVDNDGTSTPTVTLSATDPDASEAGLGTGTFTISRSGSTTSPLTVSISITGTATNGTDFQTVSTTKQIPVGSASTTIDVTPINDTLVEGNETVVLSLTGSGAYTVGSPNSGTITIADDDSILPSVTLSATTPNASETGPVNGTFTITRSGATASTLDVTFSISGTAANGTDYTTISTTKQIPAGSLSTTISVVPIDDTLIESSETVVLSLMGSGAYTIGSPNSGTVNIADNDAITLTNVSPNTAIINQASGTITLTGTNFLSGDQAEFQGFAQTMTKNMAGISCASGTCTGTVSLTAGETQTMGQASGTVRVKRPLPTPFYSGTQAFDITAATAPTLTNISLTIMGYNVTSPTITLTGTNFTSGIMSVSIGQTPPNQVVITPTNVTATSAEIVVSNTDTLTLDIGIHPIFVTVNGQSSGSLDFEISLPTLTNVSPNTAEYNTNPSIVLTSRYFGGDPDVHIGPLTFNNPTVSGTTLTVNPTIAQINSLGVNTFPVTVENTGKVSNPPFSFTTTDPLPSVSTVSPSIPWDAASTAITLTGTKFQSATPSYVGSKVDVGILTNLSPTSVAANNQSLQFGLSSTQIQSLGVGQHQVHVVNGSKTSVENNKFLIITEVNPVLNTIVPNPIEGGQDYSIILNGSKIQSYAKAVVGTLPDKTPVSVTGNTSLQFNLTATEVATLKGAQAYPFTVPIRIKNDSTHLSSSVNLNVNAPSGTTAPGSFAVATVTGTSTGDLDVSWTLAGGTTPVSYTLRGVPKLTLTSVGNNDAIIDPAEFDTLPTNTWVYDTLNPFNPFTYTGTGGTEYCFAAKATNAIGFSYSDTSCAFAASAQSPPGSFNLSGNEGSSPGIIDLGWTPSGGNPNPRYTLRGVLKSSSLASDGLISDVEFEDAGNASEWAITLQTDSPYSFAGIPSEEYCFAVKSQNLVGFTFSNTVCVRAKDNPPLGPPSPPGGGDSGSGGGGGGSGGGGGGSGPVCGNGICSPGEAIGCPQDCGGSLTCTPTLELCDGIDNDCDADIDEGCVQTFNTSTCFNGQLDEGELDVDCGGICTAWCVDQNPVPGSFYGFAILAVNPLLLFVQIILFLFGGTTIF